MICFFPGLISQSNRLARSRRLRSPWGAASTTVRHPTGARASRGATDADRQHRDHRGHAGRLWLRQPLTSVNVGELVYISTTFTTEDLPSSASYRVGVTMNGLTQDSAYITSGAGISGTESWHTILGTYVATPGTNDVTAIVDPDHSVAETTYDDNTTSFSFGAVCRR